MGLHHRETPPGAAMAAKHIENAASHLRAGHDELRRNGFVVDSRQRIAIRNALTALHHELDRIEALLDRRSDTQ